MANRHNGEVAFKALGEDATIRITLGAMAEIEDALRDRFEKAREDGVASAQGFFHVWLIDRLIRVDSAAVAAVARATFKGTDIKWDEVPAPIAELAGVLADAVNMSVGGRTFSDVAKEVIGGGDEPAPPPVSPTT